MKKLRIGTRGSALALRQAELVKVALEAVQPGIEVEIITLVSIGDLKQGTPLAERGDKKDWIAGLEEAILDGRVDMTVNSSKDVPLDLIAGTELVPVLPRENPLDVLITRTELPESWTVSDLPRGARIGTASLRRQAQLLLHRKDLIPVNVRGNITTRLSKFREQTDLFGIVLAYAGIKRLAGTGELSVRELRPEVLLPAVNQGIIASQISDTRSDLRDLLLKTTTPGTLAAWRSERAVIAALGADCHSAVGVLAEVTGAELQIRAQVLAPDGSSALAEQITGSVDAAAELGERLGLILLSRGAGPLLSSGRV